MGRITVFELLTLDGVMQAPAGRDEDTRGGFQHGGWAMPYADPAQIQLAGEGAMLLGRRTYEQFYAYWPHQTGNPFTEWMNAAHKYVASTTLREPLPWRNSILLKGDMPEAVAKVKAQSEADIIVLGSGVLVQTLMKHNLVDQYILNIHPLVLGSGRHLFSDGSVYASLRLVDAKTTNSGVVVATYEAT